MVKVIAKAEINRGKMVIQPGTAFSSDGDELRTLLAARAVRYPSQGEVPGAAPIAHAFPAPEMSAHVGEPREIGTTGDPAETKPKTQQRTGRRAAKPVDPLKTASLRQDGPTVEEYVKAGYRASNYPPAGYASKSTDDEIAKAIEIEESLKEEGAEDSEDDPNNLV